MGLVDFELPPLSLGTAWQRGDVDMLHKQGEERTMT